MILSPQNHHQRPADLNLVRKPPHNEIGGPFGHREQNPETLINHEKTDKRYLERRLQSSTDNY